MKRFTIKRMPTETNDTGNDSIPGCCHTPTIIRLMRKLAWSVRLSLLLLFMTGLAGTVSAQYITVDGDPSDWPPVFTNGAIDVKLKVDDPVNSTDDNIWTGGSSATGEISSWAWTQNGANDKGDIQNAGIALVGDTVFFFADRYANNGDDAVGIWIFVNPVSLNPDGTFSGVHTNGDILITSHFINGGTVGDRHAYVWTDGVLVERIIADVDLSVATNTTDVAAPAAWNFVPKFGSADIYPENSFFEGYINLAAFDGIDLCFSSFIIETRNSQSLDASLEDIVAGDFITKPFISLEDVTVCTGSPATFTVQVTGEPAAMYFWAENDGAFAVGTNTYTIDPATTSGTVSVYVVGESGCTSDTLTADLNVVDNPACSITGDDNVCPGSTNIYSAPDGMDTYAWSVIAGTATIDGSASGQTVSVIAPASCGNYTLQLVVTVGTCSNTCTEEFTAFDETDPVITPTGTTLDLGCNPTDDEIDAALGTATATDNCDGDLTPTPIDGAVMTTGCNRSQTRTWNVTDACGNSGMASRTVTWKVDITDPVITPTGTTLDLGCNPTDDEIDAALGTATATDDCDGDLTPTPTDGAVMTDGCSRSQTRTWNVTDACGNSGMASRTVTWKVDITDPVITPTGTTLDLGCNPTDDEIDAALGTATATDDCDGDLTPTPTDGTVMTDGCSRSQTRTWNVTDECGNSGMASRTVTWKVDITDPVITPTGTTLDLGCNPTDDEIDAALGTATATDDCDGDLTPTPTDGAVMTDGCSRSQTRTWNVTDECGNSGMASRTVTWKVDITDPVITPTGTTLELGCNPSDDEIEAALGTATATDNCDGDLTPAPTDGTVITNGCNRSQTRTWNVTDACGNSAMASRTVTWTANTGNPVITPTGTTLDLGCNPTDDEIDAALGTATATDDCEGDVVPDVSDGAVIINGCGRSQTRTWTVEDACGNSAMASRTVTWKVDITDPVITPTGTTLDLGCNPTDDEIDAALGTATATDDCDGDLTPTPTDGAVMTDGCSRSQTRTWNVTDACGNSGMASRTVTWKVDITDPVITPTGTTLDLGCNPTDDEIDAALGTATATDDCDGDLTPTPTDGAVMIDGCGRSQTRTWNVTDECGNSGMASRTVTWKVDVTDPVITPTGTTLDLGCNPTDDEIDAALGTATATDDCDGDLTPTPTDGAVMTDGCSRSQTRTWNVTDECGNSGMASRTVTWKVDVTDPVITPTGTTLDLGCNPTDDEIDAALGTATATDDCDGDLTPTPTDGAVMTDGCSRSQTRTWNVTDACGNSGMASRTVTWKVDITDPVITPTGTTLDLGCNPTDDEIDAALGTATATDDCDGDLTPTPTDGTVMTDGCGRSQTRTWNVTDECGNSGMASRTVTWKVDITDPVITPTGTTLDLGCNPTDDEIDAALGTATATDDCDGDLTPTPTDGAVMTDGCSRSQTRTWNVTDACGNSGMASRTVTWKVDITDPVITPTGTTLDLGCNPTDDEIDAALGTATATDDCDGDLTPTPTDGTVMTDGCSRSQTRTWNVTDECGNSGMASRTVTWKVDVTDPVITPTGTTLDLGCNPTDDEIDAALGTATATDDCDGDLTPTPTDGAVMTDGCSRSQTRTWNVTDECGNSGMASRTVTWKVDITDPVITPTGTTLDLGCNPTDDEIDAALGTATATDDCDGDLTPTPTDGAVMTDGCARSQTRTWNVTDECGNSGMASRTVIWKVDITDPVITPTGTTLDLGCNPTDDEIEAALGTATATDDCDGDLTPTPTDGAVMTDGCGRSQTRTWTATDACGNSGMASRTVTWIFDMTAPVLDDEPADVDLECNDDIPEMPTIAATDNCGAASVTPSSTDDPADCSTGFNRIITRTWTATDDCGNMSSHTQTIRVKCCPEVLCTYTQGYFGNAGGKACNGDAEGPNQFSTFETIQNSINAQGGSITIGVPGNSVVVTSSATDVNKVIEVLPGGGGSYAFTHNSNASITALPGSYLKKGRINNTLFAQTLTLSINNGINSDLGTLALEANKYLVTADVLSCGSSTMKDCSAKVYGQIPQALYDALSTKDINGLLELANSALGGEALPAGVSLGMIASAVDMINNAFDECRLILGWYENTPDLSMFCDDPNPIVTNKTNISTGDGDVKKLKVEAFPNPYVSNFKLRIFSPETGMATIDFYSINGAKIAEMKHFVLANYENVVEVKKSNSFNSNVFYKVSVGKFSTKGIVLKPN